MNAKSLRRHFSGIVPATIVGRATALILGMSLLMSAVFGAAASVAVQRYETVRLQNQLSDLLVSLEHTISIACYVKDAQLAGEIAKGFEHNKLVVGLNIEADGERLYERLPTIGTADILLMTQPVRSPFEESQIIGRITVQVSRAAIRAKAWDYTRVILLLLGLGPLLVAAGVAWIVSRLITRPIKTISDELHRLELRTGMQLQVPRINRQDEIGRLVGDVNAIIGKLSDMVDTERQLRIERERGERRLSLIFEKADSGIFLINRQGQLLSWNPAFARMLPTVAAAGPMPSLQTLLAPEQSRADELIRRCHSGNDGADDNFELQSEKGDTRWLNASLDPIDDDEIEGILNDISAHKHAEHEAQQLAARDPLTGLLNRRGLQAQLLARKIFPATGTTPQTALMMMDLDYFKQVNDTYGHGAGDQVLLEVSRRLQATVRRADLVARAGGDEFIIVLIGIDSVAAAEAVARSVITAVSQPIALTPTQTANVGASIGLTLLSPDDVSVDAALTRADRAMYEVKQAGRGQVRVAPPAPLNHRAQRDEDPPAP